MSTPKDVFATLNYGVDNKTRPYFYAYVRSEEERKETGHEADFAGSSSSLQCLIRDGRGGAVEESAPKTEIGGRNPLTLRQHGFELCQQATKLKTDDFYKLNTNPALKEQYYKEMEDFLLSKFRNEGAERVKVFHHQVRNEAKKDGDIQNLNTDVQGYALGSIHTDSHSVSADETFAHLLEEEEDKHALAQGRFVYINVWRNISEAPVEDNHLAVLDDSSTVKPDDYISADLFLPGKMHIAQYHLNARNQHRHRWYYFSAMRKDELLVFKHFDSDPSQPSRVTFHCAFSPDDKEPTTKLRPRESIEARALVFFPKHTPNTCPPLPPAPSAGAEDEEGLLMEGHKKKMEGAVRMIAQWPPAAKSWLKQLVRLHGPGEAMVAELTRVLTQDSTGHLGIKPCSAAHKERLLQHVLADAAWTQLCQAQVARLDKGQPASSLGGSGAWAWFAAGLAVGVVTATVLARRA